MKQAKKVLIVHNIVTPYRQILFHKLGEIYNLTILYLKKIDNNRLWSQEISDSLSFKNIFVKTRSIKLFSKEISFSFNVCETILNNRPDYIVIPDDPAHLLTSYFIAHKIRGKIPIVIWSSTFEYYKPFNNKFINYIAMSFINVIKKSIYEKSFKIITYSVNNIEYIERRFKIHPSKIEHGLQGYPTDLVPIINGDFNRRYTNNIFVFVGYIDKRKGLDLLLSAFTYLHDSGLEFFLKIIGVGSQVESLKEKFSKISHRVEWVGYVDGERKFLLINEAKCLVLPSRYDPWGWVVNEAMSLGVPCIVSESCMAKEMVSFDSVFECESIDDLTIKLTNILNMTFVEYVNLSIEAKKMSDKHTEKKPIDAFLRVLGGEI